MVLPAFTGVDAVRGVEGLGNPRGFILIDRHQRNPAWPNVYSLGVCVAIPTVETTPVPTGAPKTGFMIESMVKAVARNNHAEQDGKAYTVAETCKAIRMATLGEAGVPHIERPNTA